MPAVLSVLKVTLIVTVTVAAPLITASPAPAPNPLTPYGNLPFCKTKTDCVDGHVCMKYDCQGWDQVFYGCVEEGSARCRVAGSLGCKASCDE